MENNLQPAKEKWKTAAKHQKFIYFLRILAVLSKQHFCQKLFCKFLYYYSNIDLAINYCLCITTIFDLFKLITPFSLPIFQQSSLKKRIFVC